MCYDAAYYARRLRKLEERYGQVSYDKSAWEKQVQLSAFSKGKIPVLTPEHPHEIQMLQWGFVPVFAKDAKDGEKLRVKTPNCRADTLRVKLEQKQNSMFKPLVNHPCVILLDGFYEWHTLPDGKTKIPYFISMKDGETFAVAGLTSTWKDFADPENRNIGVTLCTTSANPLLAYVHNVPKGSEDFRMPSILEPEEIKTWLDTSIPVGDRLSLARPYSADAMQAYSVANFKKKDFDRSCLADVLPPMDYHIVGLPTKIDGADLEYLITDKDKRS